MRPSRSRKGGEAGTRCGPMARDWTTEIWGRRASGKPQVGGPAGATTSDRIRRFSTLRSMPSIRTSIFLTSDRRVTADTPFVGSKAAINRIDGHHLAGAALCGGLYGGLHTLPKQE